MTIQSMMAFLARFNRHYLKVEYIKEHVQKVNTFTAAIEMSLLS